ncbi:MAG: hypothetical protein HYW63_04315 [Candidatus Levybacteria bacterium]|nr:hypothetical protein [Candidatus Levybacteria bacterium]
MIVLFSLVIAILFETTLTSLPLTLLMLIFAAVALRNNWVFALAFFGGLLLDILKLGTAGVSSLFFVVMVMIIFAYQKKLEIASVNFILIAGLIGSFSYLFLTQTTHLFIQVFLSTVLITLSFFVFKKFNKGPILSWKK